MGCPRVVVGDAAQIASTNCQSHLVVHFINCLSRTRFDRHDGLISRDAVKVGRSVKQERYVFVIRGKRFQTLRSLSTLVHHCDISTSRIICHLTTKANCLIPSKHFDAPLSLLAPEDTSTPSSARAHSFGLARQPPTSPGAYAHWVSTPLQPPCVSPLRYAVDSPAVSPFPPYA